MTALFSLIAFLIFMGVLVVVAQHIAARPKRLTRPERKELAELREFKRTVRTHVNQERAIDPHNSLAAILDDEVTSTERRIES